MDDVGRGQAGQAGVFRSASAFGAVARTAGAHVRHPAVRHHVRHRGMIVGVPIRHKEQIALLGDGEARGAVRNMPRHTVVGSGLEIRSPGIGPCRERARCCGSRSWRALRNRNAACGHANYRDRGKRHSHWFPLLSSVPKIVAFRHQVKPPIGFLYFRRAAKDTPDARFPYATSRPLRDNARCILFWAAISLVPEVAGPMGRLGLFALIS